MKDEKKVEFTQKWIGDAVKKLLEKEDIYESDMENIKCQDLMYKKYYIKMYN